MRFRRWVAVLLAGGMLALGVTSASPAMAQVYPPPPPQCVGFFDIGTAAPNPVAGGGSVTFSGCGYAPGSSVQIYVNFQSRTPVTADVNGDISVKITAPPGPGLLWIATIGTGSNGSCRLSVAIVLVT